MKCIGAAFFLRPDAIPDVNHMCGMQCQIVLNKIFWPEIKFVCTIPIQTALLIYAVKPPFTCLLRHT